MPARLLQGAHTALAAFSSAAGLLTVVLPAWLRRARRAVPSRSSGIAQAESARAAAEARELAARQAAEEEAFRLAGRAMDATTDTLLLADLAAKITYVNAGFERVTGYTRAEVLGRKSTEFLTEASRRHAVATILPDFLKTGQCRDVEYRFIKKNGEVMDCLLSAIAEHDADGNDNE